MKVVLSSIIVLMSFSVVSGQGVRGVITGNGYPVSYAHVYVPALSKGTIANVDGVFDLPLPQGGWEVVFQSMGYKTVSRHYVIGDSFQDITVSMEPQSIIMGEIRVMASGEDPAYYVMRRAIAMAPYYDKQVVEYESMLYLKGHGVATKIPRIFRKQLKKEGIEENKMFVIESVNKLRFELPDRMEQQVIAMRSSGDDYNINPLPVVSVSLYNAAKYGIASPVDRNALNVYKFEQIGVFEDQGRLINKIRVTPNNKNRDRTFEGIINIVDQYWNIHSADLKFRMSQVDVAMEQIYGLVDEKVWMPVGMNFKMGMKALGFVAEATYVASFSDYKIKLNDQLDHSVLTRTESAVRADVYQEAPPTETKDTTATLSRNMEKVESLLGKEDLSTREMYRLQRLIDKEAKQSLPREPLEIPQRMRMQAGAIRNDSAYWTSIRPVVLTTAEKKEFERKDDAVARRGLFGNDSARREANKFRVGHVFFGRTYRKGSNDTRYRSAITMPGLISQGVGVSFSTVDGFKYTLPLAITVNDSLGRRLQTDASVAYAFSRTTLYGSVSSHYIYNGRKMRWVSLNFGRSLDDFKGASGITQLENSIYTLFWENNFRKFYERRYINAGWGSEIINGLGIKTAWTLAQRVPVSNNSTFRIIDRSDRSFTPNIPDIPGLEAWQLERSKAFTGRVEITYTPRQRYRIRNGMKSYGGSNMPTFGLAYEKGFNGVMNSDVDYDFLRVSVMQRVPVGVNDNLRYYLYAGKFIRRKTLYATDYVFFNTNNQVFAFSDSRARFYLPDYYALHSNNHFLEGHISFESYRLFVKLLPVLRDSFMQERLKASFVTTGSEPLYTELSYTLKDIFFLFDVGVTLGLTDFKDKQTGFRLVFNLN